jgi:hypothetical protein
MRDDVVVRSAVPWGGAVPQDWPPGRAGDAETLAAIDTTVANQARIYDYWLGGKDNFAVDWEAAEQAIAAYPAILRGVCARSQPHWPTRDPAPMTGLAPARPAGA